MNRISPAPPALILMAMVLTALLLAFAVKQTDRTMTTDSCTGQCQETRKAMGQWQALWSEIVSQGEAALAPDTADRSLRASGDTVFMRYRDLWQSVEREVRHTFQLAALANDPAQKLALLEPLTQRIDKPLIQFRALLEIARIALRQRRLDAAREATQQALALEDIGGRVEADAYFIQGYIDFLEGRLDSAETTLARAVAEDPGYWDARQVQLQVLSRQLSQREQRLAKCLDRIRLLIENLGAMPVLAQNRTQFRDIADYFASKNLSPNPAFYLVSGLGYLWAGDRESAKRTLKKVQEIQGKLPFLCERLVREQTNRLLDHL